MRVPVFAPEGRRHPLSLTIMSLDIKRNNQDELVITLKGGWDTDKVQRVLDYLRHLEFLKGSKVSQRSVDALAKDAKRNWWRKNKKRFVS